MGVVVPVIHAPMAGKFDHLTLVCLDDVGHVVAHQRSVVKKTVLDQEVCGELAEMIERRTPATWVLAGHALDDVDAFFQPVTLVLDAFLLVRTFMDVAVMGDFVAILEHRLDDVGVLFRAPGRNEESLMNAVAGVHIADAFHRIRS